MKLCLLYPEDLQTLLDLSMELISMIQNGFKNKMYSQFEH